MKKQLAIVWLISLATFASADPTLNSLQRASDAFKGQYRLKQDQKRPFHVEIDCQDLDATCALLKEAGFQPEGPTTQPWGERDALMVDPDGNLVEFGQAHGPQM
jgi:uncharacterized glyoxalase superfamily protein PhnB